MTTTKLLLMAAVSSLAIASFNVTGAAAQNGSRVPVPELRPNHKPFVKTPNKPMCYYRKVCYKTPKGLVCNRVPTKFCR